MIMHIVHVFGWWIFPLHSIHGSKKFLFQLIDSQMVYKWNTTHAFIMKPLTPWQGSGGELVYLERVFGKVPANLYLLTTSFIKYPSVGIILTRSSFSYLMKCVNSSANTDIAPLSYGACATGIIATGQSSTEIPFMFI